MLASAGPYSTYEGSPVSQGILQPDMWGVKPSDRWDWDGLRRDIAQHGVRNSLLVSGEQAVRLASVHWWVVAPGWRPLICVPNHVPQVAPMPTASTSQILGNNECFEPYTSNIYVRRVLSGGLAGKDHAVGSEQQVARLGVRWLFLLQASALCCPCCRRVCHPEPAPHG